LKRLALVLTLLLAGACIAPAGAAHSPGAINKGTPKIAIENFYAWYVHVLNQDGDPLTRQRTKLRQFASARLLRELDRVVKGPDGLDGDYFLDAQDWDKQWEKNIAVSQLQIRNGRAFATVSLTGPEMSRKLKVQLVLEGGRWKIDKVQSLE
jgi:hypothetical protein